MRAQTPLRISDDLRTYLLHALRAGGRREGVAQRQRTYNSTHSNAHDDLLTGPSREVRTTVHAPHGSALHLTRTRRLKDWRGGRAVNRSIDESRRSRR